MGSPFFEETRVMPAGPGRYDAVIDPAWNLVPLPQGGLVTALALGAMEHALGDPSHRPRTLHTAYVGQVADGPVTVEVEVLRRGRSMSHVRAEVCNPGAARGHLTTAIFGKPREGFSFTDVEPPDAPPPDDCPSWRDPPPPGFFDEDDQEPPFWATRLQGRTAYGHAPWEEYVPDRAERVVWYRFDHSPLRDDGTMDPGALVILADTMPGAVSEKVGSLNRQWFAPSVDLTVHLLDDCRSPWVLAHNRARHAGDGYASVDMTLWDCGEDGTSAPRLVAYGTQLFLFTFRS
jgi:acyl-CoA thioesterase